MKYFFIFYKKNVLCLNENLKINIIYLLLMKLIGNDFKVWVDEMGFVREFYWGDILFLVLYV